MSPHGEEAYKDLIYLNDAYKHAIIDSQGQEKNSWDVENCLNALLWNRRGLNMCFRWAVWYPTTQNSENRTVMGGGGGGTRKAL